MGIHFKFSLKFSFVLVLLAMLFVGQTDAYGQTLYSIDVNDNRLNVIDPTGAAPVRGVDITLAGKTVNGGTGLAAHPNGQLYAILKLSGQTGRELVTIDPATGVATSIGNTGRMFAALAFDCTGALFGITGDGDSTNPETLYSIN